MWTDRVWRADTEMGCMLKWPGVAVGVQVLCRSAVGLSVCADIRLVGRLVTHLNI